MYAHAEHPEPEAPRREDGIVVLHDVPWDLYERILEVRGERSAPRIAYLEGELELMTPSYDHEAIKKTFARLVEIYALDAGIPIIGVGSWTLREEPEERGIEPDECYILGRRKKDRPDLAVEVIWSSGGLDKLEIYRRLGVREVWIWRRGEVHVHALRGDRYEPLGGSELLPDLDLEHLAGFLGHEDQGGAVEAYRESLKERAGS